MQKATSWNMPLAPVVGKTWVDFTQLPKVHRSTFYWWASGTADERSNASIIRTRTLNVVLRLGGICMSNCYLFVHSLVVSILKPHQIRLRPT